MNFDDERRRWIAAVLVGGAGAVLLGDRSAAEETATKAKFVPADVNATEDLMREHGVLRRVLGVYEEGARRIRADHPPSADVLKSAAGVIQRFIEAYHEKLEEEEVFPRLEKLSQLSDLTRVLRVQHQAGRKLTAQILARSTAAVVQNKAQGQSLAAVLEEFIRMYRPHASREDTVLFPAFHALFTEKEFDQLGERFEEKEHQLLGTAGFEGTVEQVAQLEKELGIFDLAQFTPA